MRTYASTVVKWFVVSALLAGSGRMYAAETATDLVAKLDELDRSIADTREVATRTSASVEQLRKSLYEAAVQLREAKRTGDEFNNLTSENSPVYEEIGQLRAAVASATTLIRELNNHLNELSGINAGALEKISDNEGELAALKDAVVDPDKAAKESVRKKIAKLEADLSEANDLADQRGKMIAKLNKDIRSLQKGDATSDALTAKPAQRPQRLVDALDLLAAAKIDEAIGLFNKVLFDDPESDDARLGLAACYFERGEFNVATRMIDEVLSRDKANAWALGLRGAVLFRQGDLREARRTLEKSLKLDDGNAYVHNYLGVVLFQSGKKDGGIAEVQKAIQIDPAYISALYNLSIMLATSDTPDLVTSRLYYERAISLGSPHDPLMDKLLGIAQ